MTDEHSAPDIGGILVIGGGISGLTAALEAAEVGKDVFIVEKNAYMGGRVAQLHHYFPKLCPPSCGLEINFRRLKNNRRIRMFTMTEVKNITGTPGDYTVTLESRARYVNNNCTACNACVEVCPEIRDNAFNFNLDTTKAIYKPHEHSFPMKYVVDMTACTRCGKCANACKYNAIELDMQPKSSEIKVGSVIVATGWNPYDSAKLTNLKVTESKSIITNMMMERMAAPAGPTGGKIIRPSDNKEPASIAFVQCAGSRDENHLEYCSYICCMATMKQITYIQAQNPSAKIYVFYIDLRTPGKYEKFRAKLMGDPNVHFIKGKVADICAENDNSVTVVAENAVTGEKIRQRVDMAVLATGMEPAIKSVATTLKIKVDTSGFVVAEDEKALFCAGVAKKAADVVTSAQSATAAALKAIQVSRR